jgi:hypothetical protein
MTDSRKRWAKRRCLKCRQPRHRTEFDELPNGDSNPNCSHCVSRARTAMLRAMGARQKAAAQAKAIRRAPRHGSFTAQGGP